MFVTNPWQDKWQPFPVYILKDLHGSLMDQTLWLYVSASYSSELVGSHLQLPSLILWNYHLCEKSSGPVMRSASHRITANNRGNVKGDFHITCCSGDTSCWPLVCHRIGILLEHVLLKYVCPLALAGSIEHAYPSMSCSDTCQITSYAVHRKEVLQVQYKMI